MIDDFPVGDSLHLIDLGIMKRHLLGWRDGNMGNYRAKWSARTTEEISRRLKLMKMPSEIHRSVRGLDCLAHWKGTEFRTFFYYLSLVVLKPVLPADLYEHFLVLFCAVTICSSKTYSHLLNLAHKLLLHYIEIFKKLYGEDYITSNVHNLNHLVDDVKKFGVLSEFNAYPFESKLCQIKNLLRTGNNPLSQAAKRLIEIDEVTLNQSYDTTTKCKIPKLTKETVGENTTQNSASPEYAKVQINDYSLSNDRVNKWFLTKSGKIVGMKHARQLENSVEIYGSSLKQIDAFFKKPILSTRLSIYISDGKDCSPEFYNVNDIKCKMVAIPISQSSEFVFVPLLHTL